MKHKDYIKNKLATDPEFAKIHNEKHPDGCGFNEGDECTCPTREDEGKCDESNDGTHWKCSHNFPSPEKGNEWDRKDTEKKLKVQIRTIVSMVNAFDPKSEEALFAVTLPNLLTFMYSEVEQAEEKGFGRGVEAITSGKLPMGASQWRNHGEKYGYDKYFEEQAEQRERQRICTRLLECAEGNFVGTSFIHRIMEGKDI